MADAIKGKNDDRHSIKEVLDKAVCIKHTGYKLTQLCSWFTKFSINGIKKYQINILCTPYTMFTAD